MEFLIKRTDGDWFDLPRSRFDEVLRSSSYPSNRVSGWGDYRIELDGCQVSFSYEDAGILINFECSEIPEDKAFVIVEEIAKNVSAVTGHNCAIIRL